MSRSCVFFQLYLSFWLKLLKLLDDGVFVLTCWVCLAPTGKSVFVASVLVVTC